MAGVGCDCMERTMREILDTFPAGKREALIPLLQAMQEALGYLPEAALEEIAAHLALPTSKVFGVATFYNQFRLRPIGKHVIRVCRGTACHVRGSERVLHAFSDALDIPPGGTTPDGNFTLETVACLGACSIAPVVTVDEDFHGAVEPKAVNEIIAQYPEE